MLAAFLVPAPAQAMLLCDPTMVDTNIVRRRRCGGRIGAKDAKNGEREKSRVYGCAAE
jgi:hypothetical protein